MGGLDGATDAVTGGSPLRGRLLNPFAGLAGDIASEERHDPRVEAALVDRFRRTIHFSALATGPTVIGLSIVLRAESSHLGLLIWVLLTTSHAVAWLVLLRRPAGPRWMRFAVALQIGSGATYGALPFLAMPTTATWQMFVAAFTLGVQAANVLFSSQIRRFFWSFHLPHVVLSVVGFMFLAHGPSRWGALLIAFAAVFSAGLSQIDHLTSLSAAALGVRSNRLADGLREERQALAAANRRLAEQARTDGLTGLPNRVEFLRRLDAALGTTHPSHVVGVAYVDLDGFKAVNDSLGHRMGDLLLVAVTNRLSARLAKGETLARIGGDELVVLAPRLEVDGLPDLGRRLADAFVDAIVIDGRPIKAAASIGLSDSTVTSSPEDLLRFADTALYRSKATREGTPEVFGAELEQQLGERMALERDLATALDGDQLVPYLQPVIETATGAVMGAEALIRWEHPSGVRAAGRFINVAAELGLLEAITDNVLSTVIGWRLCRSTTWNDLHIAVNVGPRHLEYLLPRYEETGSLEGITLEITEESSFTSIGRANDLIARARQAGARVLLDDFGVGFSSLAWALELDVDGYKIDRSFVAPLATSAHARALIAGVVEMAHQQNRTVIAEGAESVDQVKILRDLGINLVQGFVYHPALPVDVFDQLLEEPIDIRADRLD
ncbi:MAG: EAL domain-containing protein [Actinomycetota bacterium]